MEIAIRAAEHEDLPRLATMNLALISDEKSRNPMDKEALQERMESWLESEWNLVLFEIEEECIGYALFRLSHDAYFPNTPLAYIRQFYIETPFRGRGFGRECFERLRDQCFPTPCRIELEVLHTNPNGAAFWQKLGFEVYSTTLTQTHNRPSPL
jgi:ribosomal protein S18 acetylase RimI-like enzyme